MSELPSLHAAINARPGLPWLVFSALPRPGAIDQPHGLWLREGASGVPRSTYCFRHTYATFRLAEGVDVYFLAEQMGTSVKMIEEHYGHVNTVKHADLVLQGMGGWDAGAAEDEAGVAKASRAPRAKVRTAEPGGKLRRRKS